MASIREGSNVFGSGCWIKAEYAWRNWEIAKEEEKMELNREMSWLSSFAGVN